MCVVLLCKPISPHIYQKEKAICDCHKANSTHIVSLTTHQIGKWNRIVSRSITEFDEIPAVTARGSSINIFVSVWVLFVYVYLRRATLFITIYTHQHTKRASERLIHICILYTEQRCCSIRMLFIRQTNDKTRFSSHRYWTLYWMCLVFVFVCSFFSNPLRFYSPYKFIYLQYPRL